MKTSVPSNDQNIIIHHSAIKAGTGFITSAFRAQEGHPHFSALCAPLRVSVCVRRGGGRGGEDAPQTHCRSARPVAVLTVLSG